MGVGGFGVVCCACVDLWLTMCGVPSSAVRVVTGYQSDAMLATYTRPRSLFESLAGAFFD